MKRDTYSFGRKIIAEKSEFIFSDNAAKNEKNVFGKINNTVQREEKDLCEGKNNGEKRDAAAGLAMVAGCVAILLFLFFGAFGKNVEPVTYSNYTNDEYEDAISVFSQILYPDGRIEKSSAEPFEITTSETSMAETAENSANAESTFSETSGTWNFWQYLCDSLAELFGVTNAE